MINKVKAFAILPIAVSLTFFGLQAVTSSIASTTTVGETEASTGATAATIEDCEWYLDGVADILSLTHATDMEYVGDDYELTAENNGVIIYFSGTEDEDVRCSFYDDVRGIDVEVSWVGTSFANVDGSDTSLDWILGESLEDEAGVSSLDIEYVKGTCDDVFAAGTTVSITNIAMSPVSPASISDEDTASFFPSTLVTEGDGPTFAKCTLDANYTVVLPGGNTPLNPGSEYIFVGPTLTTTITVSDGGI